MTAEYALHLCRQALNEIPNTPIRCDDPNIQTSYELASKLDVVYSGGPLVDREDMILRCFKKMHEVIGWPEMKNDSTPEVYIGYWAVKIQSMEVELAMLRR